MKDSKPGQRPEPWHKEDERKGKGEGDSKGGAPLGTHSFTGASANQGMPLPPAKNAGGELGGPPRAQPDERQPTSEADPVPMEEPRATGGDMLGRKDAK